MGLRLSRTTGVLYYRAPRGERGLRTAPTARQIRGNQDIDYAALARFMQPNWSARILVTLGVLAGMGAVGGVVATSEMNKQYDVRPEFTIEPTMESEHIALFKITSDNIDLSRERIELLLLLSGTRPEPKGRGIPSKWEGEPCGARVLGKTLDRDNKTVQYRVNLGGVRRGDACDLRIRVDGHEYPYTVPQFFRRNY